jgi:predicted DNA binding CopG/RHH family protein
MKKRLPSLASDRAAEAFVAGSDLSAYDLSGLRLVRYELKPKDRAISVRLPDELLKAVRSRAKRAGIPYQRFIRMALEQAVQNGRRSS